MSIVSSNMISKQYCPECDSFDLLKLHRGFIQKKILNAENKLQCRDCGGVFKHNAFVNNMPKEVPVPLGEKQQIPVQSVSKSTDVVPEEDVSLLDRQKLSIPESGKSKNVPEENTTLFKKPPEHSGNDQLVDEVILTNEEKHSLPFVIASLLILMGAAYAYIGMPISLNAKEIDYAQMDMSIGGVQNFQISETRAEKPIERIDTAGDYENSQPASKASQQDEMGPQLTAEEVTSTPLTKEAGPKKLDYSFYINNPGLRHDLGTKADKALGGLSSRQPVEIAKIDEVIAEPLPVRQYLITKKVVPATKIVAQAPQALKKFANQQAKTVSMEDGAAFNNKAAALGVSTKDLAVLTLINQPKVAVKVVPHQKLAVKRIQKDLDKLLLQ